MKKTSILSLFALGVVALATSCRDKGVEIVEQDPSYTLDANVISVDIPAPFVFNDNNIVRYNGSTELFANAKVDASSVVTMANNTIDLSFTLRRPFATDTEFVLEEDRSLLDEYRGVKTDFREFPANAVSGLRFTIPQGQTSFTTRLTIADLSQLTSLPGYLTAYRLRPAQEVQKLQISESAKTFYLKVRVKPTPLGSPTNASLSTGIEGTWNKLNNTQMRVDQGTGVTSTSIASLIDGARVRSWYGTAGGSSLINFTFTRPRTVAGLVVYSRYPLYALRKFKIQAAEDEVTWAPQGEITNTGGLTAFYVKFATPIETDKLRLYDFEALQSDRTFITEEIEIYTLD